MNLFEKSRFNLVLCELHYTPIHGKTRTSCPTIEGNYILIDQFDGLTGIMLDDLEEYTEYDTDEEIISDSEGEDEDTNSITHLYQIQQLTTKYYMEYFDVSFREKPHKLIRNYHNIISQPNYIKPEIAECIYLETGECVAILKTFWVRLIQRKWKNICKERKRVIRERCNFKSLRHRELYGKWPKYCLTYPKLQGMLSTF